MHRAVDRRLAVQADSALTSYRARAHGFVFFLAQVGEGLTEPPRLVKADELDVEVYWRAPDRSKQVILGWRDGTFLPTDINYHRDHLGIVTNNFGDLIRIGEGDEVRDAVHPLSPEGLEAYDYALSDSLAIRTADGEVTVYQVQVRPRDFSRPLVVGILYIDVATAELVRFRFSFTPAAYLDRQLEDISIVLESALYENRYWLPRRQEVEIRRRVTWLDFPARGIIRGRWEIGDYDLNLDIPPELFQGPAIGGLLRNRGQSDSTWAEPLEQAIADVAQPVNRRTWTRFGPRSNSWPALERSEGLSSKRLAAGSVSDLIRVNRVQGLTLGFGGIVGLAGTRVHLRPAISAMARRTSGSAGSLAAGVEHGRHGSEPRRFSPRGGLQRPAGDRTRGELGAVAGGGRGSWRLRPPARCRAGRPPAARWADGAGVEPGDRRESVGGGVGVAGGRQLPRQPIARFRHLWGRTAHPGARERRHRRPAGPSGPAGAGAGGGAGRLRPRHRVRPVARESGRRRAPVASVPRRRQRPAAAASQLRRSGAGALSSGSRFERTAAGASRWPTWSGGSRCPRRP